MAIEYQLKFEAPATLRDLAGVLVAEGFAGTSDAASYTAPGWLAVVGGAPDRFGRFAEVLGFRPSVEIYFSIDKFAPYEAAMSRLVETVAAALAAIDADAVLVSNHDTVLMTRQRGEVTLTNRDDWWTAWQEPSLASVLDLPHRVSPLPVL